MTFANQSQSQFSLEEFCKGWGEQVKAVVFVLTLEDFVNSDSSLHGGSVQLVTCMQTATPLWHYRAWKTWGENAPGCLGEGKDKGSVSS